MHYGRCNAMRVFTLVRNARGALHPAMTQRRANIKQTEGTVLFRTNYMLNRKLLHVKYLHHHANLQKIIIKLKVADQNLPNLPGPGDWFSICFIADTI